MATTKKIVDELHDQLAGWRTKLDELRLRSHLAKREADERVERLGHEFDSAYADARGKLAEVKKDAEHEWSAVLLSIEAGWDELRKTYEQASRDGSSADD